MTFPATAVDLTPQMQELEGTKPQAVFMEGLGAPAGYTLVDRAKLNWNVPVTFDVAASSLDLTKLVPAADLKNVSETVYYEENPSDPAPGIKNMLKYTKPYGSVAGTGLDVLTVGWDGLVDLDAAVKAAGGKTDVNSLDVAMLHIPPTDPTVRTHARSATPRQTTRTCGRPPTTMRFCRRGRWSTDRSLRSHSPPAFSSVIAPTLGPSDQTEV